MESNKVDINYSLVSHVALGRYSYLNHGMLWTEGVNINIHLCRTPYGRMNFMSKTSLRLFIYFRHRLRVEKQFSNHPTCWCLSACNVSQSTFGSLSLRVNDNWSSANESFMQIHFKSWFYLHFRVAQPVAGWNSTRISDKWRFMLHNAVRALLSPCRSGKRLKLKKSEQPLQDRSKFKLNLPPKAGKQFKRRL